MKKDSKNVMKEKKRGRKMMKQKMQCKIARYRYIKQEIGQCSRRHQINRIYITEAGQEDQEVEGPALYGNL